MGVEWFSDAEQVLLSNLEPHLAGLGADPDKDPAGPLTHLLWFGDGLLAFFLISWFCTSVIWIDNDLYYAVFIWSAITFLYQYVRVTNTDVMSAIGTRWRSSLFVGGLAAVYVGVNVWNANPTERPSGVLLVFEIFWRGLAYGAVDSLVLTAFPLAIAYGVFRGDITGRWKRAGFTALAFVLIWTMSLTYHLGFDQFDDDDLVTPQLATTAVSIPAVVTANPVGSVVAQTALHVVATFRTFESDTFVPPAVDYIPDYEPPGIFGPH